MRSLIFTLALCMGFQVFAQLSNPYRLTYDGTNYLVTNRGNGTVQEVDVNSQTNTVISGLTDPTDIIFGTFAGNTILIVIADNKMKLYDPSNYNNLLDVSVTNAVEAHDAVYDPNQGNVFYVTDRQGNKIIKGEVGPPPFYPVTFSNMVTQIPKPAGMIFDAQGRLLVVSDTVDAKVYSIDTTNGSFTPVLSTNLDNFNDITQDPQGNYYISCWGDDKLWRYNSNFGDPTTIAQFNNPSGLYSNTAYDYLALACHNCNKVEFMLYHLFSPLNDISLCPGDSFYADFNPTYKGIGTYSNGNTWLVQLSDSNGTYGSPTTLATIQADTVPKSIRAQVPEGNYAMGGYRYRLISTAPAIASYFDKSMIIHRAPSSQIFESDSVEICINTSINLGPGSENMVSYDWTPGQHLDDSTAGQTSFNGNSVGQFHIGLTATHDTTGCSSSSDVFIEVIPSLQAPELQDSFEVCEGENVQIGSDDLKYRISWSPATDLSSTTAHNPIYFGSNSTIVYASFEDSAQTCSGEDSVVITVNERPDINMPSDYMEEMCINRLHNMHFDLDTSLSYNYNSATLNITPTPSHRPWFGTGDSGTHQVNITSEDPMSGCTSEDSFMIRALYQPANLELIESGNVITFSETTGLSKVRWILNGSTYPGYDGLEFPADSLDIFRTGDSVRVEITVFAYIIGSNGDTICWANDDYVYRKQFISVHDINNRIAVSPNPTNGVVQITSDFQFEQIEVLDLQGRTVFLEDGPKRDSGKINISGIPAGVYWIKVSSKDAQTWVRIVKH